MHVLLQSTLLHWDTPTIDKASRLFDLDTEANLPTAFQGLALAATALLLLVVARHSADTREARRWLIVALAVLYMSVDELARLHERLALFVRPVTGLEGQDGSFSWVFIGAPVALAMAIYLLPLLRYVPWRTCVGLLIAGATFFAGAVGMELVSWFAFGHGGKDAVPYLLASTVEETFEMAAIVLLVQVLLSYLRDRGWALTIAARE